MFRISRVVCAVAALWTGAALAGLDQERLTELGDGVYGVRLAGYTQVTDFPFKDRETGETRVLADYFVLNKPVSQATKQRMGETRTRDNLIVLSTYGENPARYLDTLWSNGMSVDFFVTKEGRLYQLYPALTKKDRDRLTMSENDKAGHLLPQGSTFNSYMSQATGPRTNPSSITVAVAGDSWSDMTEQQWIRFPQIRQLVRDLNKNERFEFNTVQSLFASKAGTERQCGFSKAHLILPEAQTLFPGASGTEVKQPNIDMVKNASKEAVDELAGYLKNKTGAEAVRWRKAAEDRLKKA